MSGCCIAGFARRAVLVTLAVACGAMFATPDANAQQPFLIAHRGASAHAPENTLAAIDIALALGADVIELDVQLSRDGIPVVIHDDTLQRTTNVAEVFARRARVPGGQPAWPVRDFSVRDLQQLDAGSWFAADFAGARIPTLVEALRQIQGRAAVIVDYKPQPDGPPGRAVAARHVADAIAEGGGRGARDWIAVSSFSLRDLNQRPLANMARFIAIDVDAEGVPFDEELFPPGLCGVSVSRRLLGADPDLPRRARESGRQVLVWAFDSSFQPAPTRLLLELAGYIERRDVYGIMTNRLEEFRAATPRDARRPSWSPCFGSRPATALPRTPSDAPSAPRRRAAPRN